MVSQIKGYPFEVTLPSGLAISGVVLADQVRKLDWNARQISFIAKSPPDILAQVLGKLETLLK